MQVDDESLAVSSQTDNAAVCNNRTQVERRVAFRKRMTHSSQRSDHTRRGPFTDHSPAVIVLISDRAALLERGAGRYGISQWRRYTCGCEIETHGSLAMLRQPANRWRSEACLASGRYARLLLRPIRRNKLIDLMSEMVAGGAEYLQQQQQQQDGVCHSMMCRGTHPNGRNYFYELR